MNAGGGGNGNGGSQLTAARVAALQAKYGVEPLPQVMTSCGWVGLSCASDKWLCAFNGERGSKERGVIGGNFTFLDVMFRLHCLFCIHTSHPCTNTGRRRRRRNALGGSVHAL